jgi:Uma2 family endonuclease
MSKPVKILPHYTYDDWIHWEGQWKLIDGIPHAMRPMPVPKHQRIANAVGGEFYLALKHCKKCQAFQAIDYKIEDDIIVQPDLLIVCADINKKYLDFAPDLVVEISSPSTALKDRHSKFTIYEQQQIKYYLIVNPDKEEVEVYSIEDGAYQLKQTGKCFTFKFFFQDNCAATVDFGEIW